MSPGLALRPNSMEGPVHTVKFPDSPNQVSSSKLPLGFFPGQCPLLNGARDFLIEWAISLGPKLCLETLQVNSMDGCGRVSRTIPGPAAFVAVDAVSVLRCHSASASSVCDIGTPSI